MSSIEGVQVGDRVWTCRFGWGTVTIVDLQLDFPIVVKWDCKYYPGGVRACGRTHYQDRFPCVFFAPWGGEHGKDPYPPRPVPKIKKWKWVKVWKNEHGGYSCEELSMLLTAEEAQAWLRGYAQGPEIFKIESSEVEV